LSPRRPSACCASPPALRASGKTMGSVSLKRASCNGSFMMSRALAKFKPPALLHEV